VAEVAKTTEVTDFLKFTLDLTMGAYDADEEDFIIDAKGERLTIGDPPFPVVLYKEKLPRGNAHVLNPFSEGISETASAKWFYKTMRVSLAVRIAFALEKAVAMAVEQQKTTKKKGEVDKATPPALLNLISTVIESADSKMIDEIGYFAKDADNIIFPLYARKMLSTRVSVPLLEGGEVDLPKTIRKGSVEAFKKLMLRLFGIDNPEGLAKFTVKAHPESTPKIDSYLRCLFNVYDQINDVVDAIDPGMTVDLGAFRYHLDHLPGYSGNARSMVSLSPSAEAAARAASTQTQQPRAPGEVRMIPGAKRIDGSQDAPTPVLLPYYGPAPAGQPPAGLRPVTANTSFRPVTTGMMPYQQQPGYGTFQSPQMFGQPPMMHYNQPQYTTAPLPYGAPVQPNWGGTYGMPYGV
jgi:hypothetical protein